MQINLDDINVDQVFDDYVARISFARHRPRTLEGAIAILVGQGLGVSVRNDVVRIQNDDRWPRREITVAVSDSSITTSEFAHFMQTTIIHRGIEFRFSAVRTQIGYERGVDEPEQVQYFELSFTPE